MLLMYQTFNKKMNFVTIVFIIIGICSIAIANINNDPESEINVPVEKIDQFTITKLGVDFSIFIKKALELLKTLMLDEIEQLGIPRLDPLDIEKINIDISHEIGDISGFMNNVTISCLSNYTYPYLEVVQTGTLVEPHPNISLKLHFDEILVHGDHYNISAYLGDFLDVWGYGPFDLVLRDFEVDVNVFLIFSIFKKVIFIDSLSIDMHLQNMTANFKNLLGGGENEELFNRVIGKIAPEAVDMFWPEVKLGVQKQVVKIANAKFEEIGFQAILDLITDLISSG